MCVAIIHPQVPLRGAVIEAPQIMETRVAIADVSSTPLAGTPRRNENHAVPTNGPDTDSFHGTVKERAQQTENENIADHSSSSIPSLHDENENNMERPLSRNGEKCSENQEQISKSSLFQVSTPLESRQHLPPLQCTSGESLLKESCSENITAVTPTDNGLCSANGDQTDNFQQVKKVRLETASCEDSASARMEIEERPASTEITITEVHLLN